MKKGFTLIELLAVIVILAIIALIAVPIILNIINDAKKEGNERSIDLYASALKNAVASYQMKENKEPTSFSDIEGYIKYDGSDVVCQTKDLYSDGKIYLANCTVDGTPVEYTYGSEQEVQEDSSHLAKKNVEAVTNPTINGAAVGITPALDENGDFIPGSTFKIKVNAADTDGSIFYVLSNDGDYVNLIAQQNITSIGEFTSEPQDKDEWYKTYDNRYGPQTAYTYLNNATTSTWTNIPVIENFTYSDAEDQPSGITNTYGGYQSIVTSLDSTSGNYITTITPYSSSYVRNPVTYENMRARLPKYSEVTATEVGCTTSNGDCPIWMVNYLSESSYYSTDDGKENSTGTNYGYWLLSSTSDDISDARTVYCYGLVDSYFYTDDVSIGIRPVITVLKSDLLRVM